MAHFEKCKGCDYYYNAKNKCMFKKTGKVSFMKRKCDVQKDTISDKLLIFFTYLVTTIQSKLVKKDKEVKFKLLKKRVLSAAAFEACYGDGDTVKYNGNWYYVEFDNDLVVK